MSRLALKAALQPAAEQNRTVVLEHHGAPVDSWLVSGKGLARARLDEAHALGAITDEERQSGLRLVESRPW